MKVPRGEASHPRLSGALSAELEEEVCMPSKHREQPQGHQGFKPSPKISAAPQFMGLLPQCCMMGWGARASWLETVSCDLKQVLCVL